MEEKKKGNGLSRRSFLKNIGGGAIGTAVISTGLVKSHPAEAYTPEIVGAGRRKTAVNLKVNGKNYRVEVEHRETLAEVLRDQLGLTGTKIGCDRGECGACTVLVDDVATYSCSTLTHSVRDKAITTIEGLESADGQLHPVQQAMIDELGPQCGFCTPGQVMSAVALLKVNPRPTRDEARLALSGNLCRCGAYDHYLNSVMRAAGTA